MSAGVLTRIIADKQAHVARASEIVPLGEREAQARRAPAPRGFKAALAAARAAGRYGLIAEIKKASPSAGLIRADFRPAELARAYARGGATCLSVLTDTAYFQGEDAYLDEAHQACSLPVLRKDFTIDPYQVVEARAIGADAVLLILAVLDDAQAGELLALTRRWEMDALVEVHDAAERDRALALGAELIGINNRNLDTLKVDLQTSVTLAQDVPAAVHLVAESGFSTPADLARCAQAGITSFLVGESLMRQDDVAAATEALLA
ncbi:MAG: indole-3-glycerol phosphate synthase TrpC [Rhodothalassiaceae bacterium]